MESKGSQAVSVLLHCIAFFDLAFITFSRWCLASCIQAMTAISIPTLVEAQSWKGDHPTMRVCVPAVFSGEIIYWYRAAISPYFHFPCMSTKKMRYTKASFKVTPEI